MSDQKLNEFVARGTNADRLAFTPDPPTPPSGPDSGYFFYETDTGNAYAWDGSAWQPVGVGSGSTGTLPLLTADPVSPTDDTWWAVRDGSPMQVSIRARISGATYEIAAITLP